MRRILYTAAFGLLAMSLAANADVTLSLDPVDGTVPGSPGDTVGWGYALDNNTSDYLLVSYSSFCEAGQDPLFTTCSPNLGASTYTDYLSSNFILLAPGDNATGAFDPTTISGVGEYSIDPTAAPGSSDSGNITVIYDLFESDPTQLDPTTGLPAVQDCSNINVDGVNVCDFEISAAATVNVPGPASAAPEPRLLLIIGACLAALIIRRAFPGKAAAK
ncbi:MAG TPA: hypothetical protein VMH80_23395 [Bryobacteraceae bacterium]|nr:hypothetical protein [Bryobacteraceae bacterium]